jgi:hypothetical protein
LAADGRPGSTRIRTLLGWMRGEGIDTAPGWSQVRDICCQIEQQLADVQPIAATAHVARPARTHATLWLACLGVLGLVVAIGLVVRFSRPAKPAPPPVAILPDAILIPSGRYPTPDGTVEGLRAFRISAHEITIGEYAGFLETLETLARDQRERTFDHDSQPPGKASHVPDEWPALYAAAKAGGTWNQRPVSLQSPVVGVDWWDAAAYAEWKQARLPTQEEWFAALHKDVAKPGAIPPAGWQPVTAATTDRTPSGLLGMAGSLSEWTRRPAPNPANPLGERLWVIVGGSFLKPGANALSREWTLDRSLRRPDLGFRIVYGSE